MTTGRRPSVLAAAGGLVALTLTACGPAPAGPPPPAQVAPAADCLADEVLVGTVGVVPQSQDRPAPAAGRIPDGFEPVLVVECRPTPLRLVEPPPPREVVELEAGQVDLDDREADVADKRAPTTLTVEEVVRAGDLSALLRALRSPSDAPSDGPCPAIGEIHPQIYLVDADGQAVRPLWPTTSCGLLKHPAFALLATVPEESVRVLEREVGKP